MAILSNCSWRQSRPSDQADKKIVVREENRSISAVVVLRLGLCARCGSHTSEEVVPTSEVLQLIQDYT